MSGDKVRWRVTTDQGARDTFAVSPGKAVRNVKYRMVMDGRAYRTPRPADFAAMRDIEIVRIERVI